MEVITYSLVNGSNNSFYFKLALFTDKILTEAKLFFSKDIGSFRKYLSKNKRVKLLSTEEYIIDFISLGIYYEKYIAYASGSGRFYNLLLYNLFRLRNRFPSLKPAIDFVRGHLSDFLLYSKYYSYYDFSPASFTKLLSWMKATGEFPDEIKRLHFWNKYFHSIPVEDAKEQISRAVAFGKYFGEEGVKYFEEYTGNINKFLKYLHGNYKKREDYLFCGRSETEYFLNIFAAEIINREQKQEFDRTNKKSVLLPACMRNPADGICKAIQKGPVLKCISCSAKCEINKLQSTLRGKAVEVILFNHSTDFSNFLKTWKVKNNGGLVGVACILNLIKGGYEMQKMNIPSQCVFLNYCGCKEHWHKIGIPTSLDTKQLNKILSIEERLEKEVLIENNA